MATCSRYGMGRAVRLMGIFLVWKSDAAADLNTSWGALANQVTMGMNIDIQNAKDRVYT